MTLRQLEYFCEIANHGWNISRAAKSLNTSQPGISRQMQAMEDELGVVLFVREKNRIIGVTEPGQVALTMAQRILRDFSNLKRLRNEFDEAEDGVLKIAATHTQARYVIPKVLKNFTQTHPKTELVLRQGTPTDLVRFVAVGVSDLSVSTLPLEVPESVVMLPCFAVDRVAVVPAGHPLVDMPELGLEDIARFPLITYDSSFIGRSSVLNAFQNSRLSPKIAVSAVDTDIMKAYAAQGLGVAIMSKVAYDATADRPLRAIPVNHLFGKDTIYIGLRKYSHLRRMVMEFICLYAPKLTPSVVVAALNGRPLS